MSIVNIKNYFYYIKKIYIENKYNLYFYYEILYFLYLIDFEFFLILLVNLLFLVSVEELQYKSLEYLLGEQPLELFVV